MFFNITIKTAVQFSVILVESPLNSCYPIGWMGYRWMRYHLSTNRRVIDGMSFLFDHFDSQLWTEGILLGQLHQFSIASKTWHSYRSL